MRVAVLGVGPRWLAVYTFVVLYSIYGQKTLNGWMAVMQRCEGAAHAGSLGGTWAFGTETHWNIRFA